MKQPNTLGQVIKQMRLAAQLTLRELASRVGMDFTYLSKIENDKTDRPPSEELLKKLAEQLGTSADSLIALSGNIPQDLKPVVSNPDAIAFFRSIAAQGEVNWADLQRYVETKKQEP